MIIAAPLAFAAGAAAAFGFEPANFWLLTVLGLAGLAALIDLVGSRWRAALIGWLWGVGHFAFGLTWIAKAFTYQAKMPAALGWAAVGTLSLYLALFVALATGAAAFVRAGPGRALVLAAAMMAGEALRGIVFTGFPWNPLGAAWLPAAGMAQLAGVIGAIGIGGLMVLAGAALWQMVAPGQRLVDRGLGLALAAVVAGSAMIGDGFNRETYYPDNFNVFVVQANIGEDERYGRDAENLNVYLALTRSALANRETVAATAEAAAPDAEAAPAVLPPTTSGAGVTPLPGGEGAATGPGGAAGFVPAAGARGAIVVWPEGAVQAPVENDPALRAALAAALGPNDLLMFGGTGLVRNGRGQVIAYANTLFVLDAKAKLRGRYDKAHLVPYGEYLPARPLMTSLGLSRLVPGDYDFAAGPGPRTLALPGFSPAGPQICYEIIFPGAVTEPGKRPAWIVAISNDAWFGASGPPQHLAQARLRAIEEGLPVVRATPTGISAILDANGRDVAVQPAGTQGVISFTLPPPLPPPFFARQGHWPPLWLGLALAGGGLLIARRRPPGKI
ncbi:hypothetical protein IP88_15585 [alpha proteobacterium AAP81b]|nr:hypothetical protein IP88_15585 [alpha proteobacterium AAP81b]